MMNSDNLDDMLATLRDSEPYLSDDGFTSGVIARLPEARQLPFWLTTLIMLGFTATGSAIVAWETPVIKLVAFATNYVSIATSNLLSLSMLGIAAGVTMLISYAVIWLAQNDSI